MGKKKRITLCGSMRFASEMLNLKQELENRFKVATPGRLEDYINNKEFQHLVFGDGVYERAEWKSEHDAIRKHYEEIKDSDAILVINKDKGEIKNYIGGNSFLEIGFAYVLKKKIYLLNPIPKEQLIFYQEILAMRPVILNGDMEKISL